jgi:hypothetical protein
MKEDMAANIAAIAQARHHHRIRRRLAKNWWRISIGRHRSRASIMGRIRRTSRMDAFPLSETYGRAAIAWQWRRGRKLNQTVSAESGARGRASKTQRTFHNAPHNARMPLRAAALFCLLHCLLCALPRNSRHCARNLLFYLA